MNSKTNHTLPSQERPAQDIQQPEDATPSWLEGTPLSSRGQSANKLMDSEEQELIPEEDDIIMGSDSDISEEEKSMLEDALDYMPTTDEESLRKAALDNTDDDGDPLNEASFGEDVSGRDLDIPGSDGDDDTEDLGDEDEENNSYSIGGDDHNDLDEKTS